MGRGLGMQAPKGGYRSVAILEEIVDLGIFGRPTLFLVPGIRQDGLDICYGLSGGMVALDRGLYELIVTKAMAQALQELEVQNKHPNLAELGQAEAADRISLHLAKVIRQVIDDFADQERVQKGSELSMRVLENLGAEGIEDDQLFQPTKILSSVSKQMPDGSYEKIEVPLTPLLDTTLLTNAPGEPVLARQLESEIDSADRIDLIMAFIRKSGLRPMLENFRRHCAAGVTWRLTYPIPADLYGSFAAAVA